MSEFKGSETEKNLQRAFAGEAITRTKYTIYSMLAKKDGYDYISRIFAEAADNEKEHAKIWLKWLNGGNFNSTIKNLEDAAKGECAESEKLYPDYAKKAREEGFEPIAELFELIAKIEKDHEETFKKLIMTISNDVVPNEDGTYNWECSVCGCALQQIEKPNFCPLCANEDVFFFKRPS